MEKSKCFWQLLSYKKLQSSWRAGIFTQNLIKQLANTGYIPNPAQLCAAKSWPSLPHRSFDICPGALLHSLSSLHLGPFQLDIRDFIHRLRLFPNSPMGCSDDDGQGATLLTEFYNVEAFLIRKVLVSFLVGESKERVLSHKVSSGSKCLPIYLSRDA